MSKKFNAFGIMSNAAHPVPTYSQWIDKTAGTASVSSSYNLCLELRDWESSPCIVERYPKGAQTTIIHEWQSKESFGLTIHELWEQLTAVYVDKTMRHEDAVWKYRL